MSTIMQKKISEGIKVLLVANQRSVEEIMRVCQRGEIFKINLCLFSTNFYAPCLKQAIKLGVKSHVLDVASHSQKEFSSRFTRLCLQEHIDMIFVAESGIDIPRIPGIDTYQTFYTSAGDKNWKDLNSLEKLLNGFKDMLKARGRESKDGQCCVCLDTHKIDDEYHKKAPLLRTTVEAPDASIRELLSGNLELAAEIWCGYVIKKETMINLFAVHIAAQRTFEKIYQDFLGEYGFC